jgi:hypothetical protein
MPQKKGSFRPMLLFQVWRELVKEQTGGGWVPRPPHGVVYESTVITYYIPIEWQNSEDTGVRRASSINFEQPSVTDPVSVLILNNSANELFKGEFRSDDEFREAIRRWVSEHIGKTQRPQTSTQLLTALDRVLTAYMSALCLQEEWVQHTRL